MSGRATILVAVLLLVLLALEVGLAFAPVPRLLLPAVAIVMIAVVALGFMRLRASGRLAAVFAAAGVFWLAVMLSLGSMDPATRTDVPVSRTPITSSP